MTNFFEIDGKVEVPFLAPKMELSKRVKIRPKYESGNFPIKIKIMANNVSIEKEYSIKVGGTEIY